MTYSILFVERKPYDSFSIEKAFRHIALGLSGDAVADFQQLPYGNRIWDTIRNLLLFRKRPADIYHITGHVHYIALLFPRRNTVLSIMDVRFLYIKPGPRRWMLKKLYLDWPLRRMDHVTAISQHTKDEIARYVGKEADKVLVLDLPLDLDPDSAPTIPFNQKKPKLLQIGTMENKNIPMLAKALNGLNCRLKIIGKMSDLQISSLRDNHVEFENAFDLNDEEVHNEYRSADIVTFCSTFEGFGLPIIEAQSMRKPVVTSRLSPMIETSGGAAVLVDPLDHVSIREGLEKVINDSAFRETLLEAGVENTKRFRREKVAVAYESLYKGILQGNIS